MARRLLEAALAAAILGLFVRTFVARPYQVASSSMAPALLPGDHLLIDRFSGRAEPPSAVPWLPGRPPVRGDVLVFQLPGRPWRTAVKRCVGLPGERVEWHREDLRVEGRLLPGLLGPSLHGPEALEPAPRETTGRNEYAGSRGNLRLGPDEIFVLGDNRPGSEDSRAWGPVPIANVRGRAFLVYWSTAPEPGYDGSDDWGKMAPHPMRRWARTRWDRILAPVP